MTLDVPEVQDIVTGMTEGLIRSKVLYPYRLRERYFLVGIDGTGMLTFPERHCPHCLTRTSKDRTLYYHPVLEAKLITSQGLVCSLMTEFIENPDEFPTKQDCELKAFYRLAERLKRRFPRLPICLLLDGLFAGGPTFSICDKYLWKYIITLAKLTLALFAFRAILQYYPRKTITIAKISLARRARRGRSSFRFFSAFSALSAVKEFGLRREACRAMYIP
ncbi:MAG: hypothetical protein JW850_10515 [Thermoflexales bacterium]|nr:hypothetical protein [Thermoflexales bacterium]